MKSIRDFQRIVLLDAEFGSGSGERPAPVCFVFHEIYSEKTVRLWLDGTSKPPPFIFDDQTLFVAFYASAELGCFLALDWPFPVHVLDLYVEFSCQASGLPTPCGQSLLGAMAAFGLDGIEAIEKERMRQRILQGGPYSDAEKLAILDYCETDVLALKKLFPVMLPTIDLQRALLRGNYMKVVAKMEWNGTPIDVPTLNSLLQEWDVIQEDLISNIDAGRGIYEGRTFKLCRFLDYLARLRIPWPTLPTGNLALSDDVFREMARQYPHEIGPLRELRFALSQMRLADLQVGADGRNRCLLSPFASRTGRNQPSNTKFIFGPAVWLRGLIKPEPDRFVAYLDFSQQELGIVAALSGDEAMMEAYRSGDFYMTFAKQAKVVPPDATKKSHPKEREQLKLCALGVQYGLSGAGLAAKLGVPLHRGQELIDLHRRTYPRFWAWSDAAEAKAILTGKLESTFGWCVHVHDAEVNPRSLRNFPAQANGAEMIRFACWLATERGVKVCCPVHDALLIEGPVALQDEILRTAQAAMREASEIVLPGFPLRTEAKIVRYPGRYMDPRGETMWNTVCDILRKRGHQLT